MHLPKLSPAAAPPLPAHPQVQACKRNMNTFAFVGDLERSPEVSCVYHSEEAENQVGTMRGRSVCCGLVDGKHVVWLMAGMREGEAANCMGAAHLKPGSRLPPTLPPAAVPA